MGKAWAVGYNVWLPSPPPSLLPALLARPPFFSWATAGSLVPAGTILLGVTCLEGISSGRSILFTIASFCCYLQTEESGSDKGSEAQASVPPPFTVSYGSPPAPRTGYGANQMGLANMLRSPLLKIEVP